MAALKEKDTRVPGKSINEDKLSPKCGIKRRTAIILIVAVIILILIVLINLGVMLYLTNNTTARPEEENEADENSIILVTPEEWNAHPAKGELDNLVLPVETVIIAHTATENCTKRDVCITRLKFIQSLHMEGMDFDDIGYNFLVGGDGVVYIGRGWNKQGAHTRGNNQGSICIAFIGNYETYGPTNIQAKTAQLLIEDGVIKRKVSHNYKLFGHRQLISTESPGDLLFNVIKTWPHWVPKRELG